MDAIIFKNEYYTRIFDKYACLHTNYRYALFSIIVRPTYPRP